MKIASAFLVDSGNSKIYLKNPFLMTKLKASMATESFTSVNIFNEILEDVISDLKRIIQDYCWSLKSKFLPLSEFEPLLLNLDADLFQAIQQDPLMMGPFHFCQSVVDFRGIQNKVDLIRSALNIGAKFIPVETPSPIGILAMGNKDIISMQASLQQVYNITRYVDVVHVENVNNRLRIGVYSQNMFNTLYEYVKRPIIMFLVDEIAKKKDGKNVKKN